jgi:preprotein translocase subunit YajC
MLLAAKTTHSSGSLVFLGILVVGYIFVYFFYLRPRLQRQRSARTQNRNFDVGDQIQTIGGLVGTVTEINDNVVTIETKSGQKLEYLKAAIQQRYVPPSVDDEPEDGDNETDKEGDTH